MTGRTRLAGELAAAFAAVVIVVTATSVALAFEDRVDETQGWVNTTYSFDESTFSMTSAMKSRTHDAAAEWSINAPGSISFSTSSSNSVQHQYLAQNVAGVAKSTCDSSSGCYLHFNREYAVCDHFYTGTGTSTGTTYSPFGWCPYNGLSRIDSWGVAVHEFGHWQGLGHSVHGSCSPAAYAPYPTKHISSMCWDLNSPSIEGGSGNNVGTRRSISQDEIQGMHNEHYGYHVANHSFSQCTGCAWDDAPDYWWFTPNSNHWQGSGVVSLNNNSSVPYPEIVQRVRGADADVDNDSHWKVEARVMAKDDDIFPRAVIFVRHYHLNYADHEVKCDSGGLMVGVWKTFTCDINASDSSTYEFEYGIRVTEKIDIDWIKVWDL